VAESNIHIGTSGFSYDDWVGTFYPPSLKPAHRLEYYATKFSTLELNSTFYTLPALPSVWGMLKKVDEGFTFFVKGHRDLTHVRRNVKGTMPKFIEMLKPYRAERKLAGVLLQFPASFPYTNESQDYLTWLVEQLRGTPVVIEFRQADWVTDEAMALLRELKAGYCIVDMPQVRGLPSNRVEVTGPIAYVRFHGQNTAKWEGAATRNERYDYEYREEELQPWVGPIINLTKYAEQTYVFFNNHYRGKAAKNAQMLQQLIEKSP
jgi:uncharacterized protein YecE (DUF72 family)